MNDRSGGGAMETGLTRRGFLTTATGILAAGRYVGPRHAAAATDRVRIVTGLRAGSQSLGWIGAEAGIFNRLGLDVTFPKLEVGGPDAEAGLARGDWDVAETGTSPIIQGVLAGRDSVILLVPTSPTSRGAFLLLARPGIAEPRQLEGARIGVLTETGQTTIGVQRALRLWGATARLIPLGTFGRIYAALGAHEIDAGALPFDYRFLGPREFGLNVLEAPGSGFQPAIVGATRKLIATNRPLVVRLVQGYVETIHFFKTRRAEVVPLLQRFLMFKDRKAVDDAYDYYAPLFQRSPRPTVAGIQTLLDELATSDPRARTLAPEAVLDASFLDDLERGGFVKRLYGD